jgi:hypothetical protein
VSTASEAAVPAMRGLTQVRERVLTRDVRADSEDDRWGIAVTVLVLCYAAPVWLPTILRRQGLGDIAAFAVSSGFTAIGVLGVLASAWLVDLVGRKWTTDHTP